MVHVLAVYYIFFFKKKPPRIRASPPPYMIIVQFVVVIWVGIIVHVLGQAMHQRNCSGDYCTFISLGTAPPYRRQPTQPVQGNIYNHSFCPSILLQSHTHSKTKAKRHWGLKPNRSKWQKNFRLWHPPPPPPPFTHVLLHSEYLCKNMALKLYYWQALPLPLVRLRYALQLKMFTVIY